MKKFVEAEACREANLKRISDSVDAMVDAALDKYVGGVVKVYFDGFHPEVVLDAARRYTVEGGWHAEAILTGCTPVLALRAPKSTATADKMILEALMQS